MNQDDRIIELESKVAELTALVERLAASPQAAATAAPPPTPPAIAPAPADETVAEQPRSTRRGLLKLAGAAAAGTAAAVATNVLPAAAADNDPITVSNVVSTTSTTRNTTGLIYENSATPRVPGVLIGTFANANIFVVRDEPGGLVFGSSSSSDYPAAIGGYSYRTVANGVYGYTANAGYGVVGYGAGTSSIGLLARGSKSNLELHAAGTAPAARSDAHVLGEVINDSLGNVWVCIAAGSPGTWRKLAGPGTAGAFHALTPGRVYDSRAPQPAAGALSGGQNRTITVKDRRVASGAVDLADFVPAGATAVAANVTVQTQSGAGFLAINPGGNTSSESSTINWSAAGQLLANGVTLTLNGNRELTVVCGGGGSTEFIIDVSGYYL